MFDPGEKVLLRTVTYHHVGEVVTVEDGFVLLKNAAWIADSGLFSEALEEGILSDIELVGIAAVNISTIVDVFPWKHALATKG